jgi:hypothetical protein
LSEDFQTIVRLDPAPADPAGIASSVAVWLLNHEIIKENSARDDLMRPSKWAPGVRWADAVAEPPLPQAWFLDHANNGVDIITERQAFDSGTNLEPPTCARCGTELYENVYFDMVQPWLHGDEPSVTCRNCGWTGLLGDWPAPWGLAVGSLAVTFNNWWPLSNTFVAEIGTQLGGRTFFVRRHL